jgi:tryptophan-rich sensory protein
VTKLRVTGADWLFAAAICVCFQLLEFALVGADPASKLEALRQPAWAPPFWLWGVIGVAWFAICLVSLARLRARRAVLAVSLLVALMLANAAWSVLLFRLDRYDLALYYGAPYAALLVALLAVVRRTDALVFALFVGYAAYLIYAGAWTWSLMRLN